MGSSPSRTTSRVWRRAMIALMGSTAAISFAAVAAIGYNLELKGTAPAVDKVLAMVGTGERRALPESGAIQLSPPPQPFAQVAVVAAPAGEAPDLDVMAESRSLQTTRVRAFGMELLENQIVNVFRAGDGVQGFGGPGEFRSFSQNTQTGWRTVAFNGPSSGGLSFGGGAGGGGAAGQGAPASGSIASAVNGDWLVFAVNHAALGVDPNLLAQNIFNSIAGFTGNGGAFFGPGGINGPSLGGFGGGGQISAGQNPGVVPIPAALPLFGSALAALGAFGWRKRRRANAAAQPA